MRKTVLFDQHKKLGAKFVEFGGWEMPVWYSNLIEEHRAVRTAAGLFDVSHMGEVFFEGPEALAALEYLTCNQVSSLKLGDAQYSMFLNEKGGVVDDIIIYRLEKEKFLVCVNASNTEKDYQWVLKNNRHAGVEITNRSSDFSQLALQGPKALEILSKIADFSDIDFSFEVFPSFTFKNLNTSHFGNIILARTGYSGEDGVEIFCLNAYAESLWENILEQGVSYGLLPVGLGARDTLRLEACLPLHGHEMSDEIDPISAGFLWVVKLDKIEDFIGKNALVKIKSGSITKKLIAFEVQDKGIVREGASVFSHDGKEIGKVTSGTLTPTLGKAIGLALVDKEFVKIGLKLQAELRGRMLSLEIVKKPFYRRA